MRDVLILWTIGLAIGITDRVIAAQTDFPRYATSALILSGLFCWYFFEARDARRVDQERLERLS